ncbi:MAG TPA: MFS transporter [Acidimicrobiales bacterium]|nr:MFS transporter [Acidimicrobiales bacterium]
MSTVGEPPLHHRRRSRLWRHRDFLQLWSAETVSQLGSQVSLLALPLIAIKQLKATPFEVGALSALEFLPFILVGLPAGVWVDRLRRRPILIAGDVGRALALASIPIAWALGALTIWQLYAVGFVTGVLTVFFDVAYMAFLPAIVEGDDLPEGNAKMEISRSGAQIAGPGLAGLLIGALTAPLAVIVDAVSFLGSAAFIGRIRVHESDPEPDDAAVRMRTQIADGLRYVLGHRLLRPIALSTATTNLFNSISTAVVLLYFVRRAHLSAGAIGLVLMIGNIGFLFGAALSTRLEHRFGVGRVIVLSTALTSPFALLTPLAPLHSIIPFAIGAQLATSLGQPLYNIAQVSLRQSICPDRLQGRMNASMRFMVWGTIPIGSFVGGALGGFIGLRATLFIGALGSCVAFVYPLLSPVWRVRTISEAIEEERRLAVTRPA